MAPMARVRDAMLEMTFADLSCNCALVAVYKPAIAFTDTTTLHKMMGNWKRELLSCFARADGPDDAPAPDDPQMSSGGRENVIKV